MAETSKNKIYYNDDENSVADVLADMKKMAESTDKAIENSKYNDAQIKKDISEAKKEQALKDAEQDNKIIELQNEKTELEKELKEAQEDFYQNSIRGQASGEYIHVEDSSNCRSIIRISGNHEQETRSGKNLLLNDTDKGTVNGVTFTKDSKGIIKANGTATDAIVVYLGSKFTTIAAGTYKLSDGRNDESKDTFFTYVDCYNTDGSAYATGNLISTSDGSVKTYTESKLIKGRIVVRKGVTLNNIVFKPQLELIKNASASATEYEQYGASPSLNYPSEIKTVGDNVNLFPGWENGTIDSTSGEKIADPWYIRCKDFIPIVYGVFYTISQINSVNFNNMNCAIRLYDKDKKYLGSQYVGVIFKQSLTFTVNNLNVKYIIPVVSNGITVPQNAKTDIKLEKGTVATPYSSHGQGNVKITKCNKNIMPILNLGNNYEYTGNGIKSLKRNDGVEVTRFKVKKGQTIKFGLKLFSRPTQDTSWTIYFDNLGIASFAHLENSSSFDLNKVYEKTYTANIDGDIFIKLWGNASSDIFEFQLWAELNILTDYVQHEEQSYIMPVQQEMLEGDTFDYDNEEEVHIWGKTVLTGDENWKLESTGRFGIIKSDLPEIPAATSNSNDYLGNMCNSYKESTPVLTWKKVQGFCVDMSSCLRIYDDKYSTNNDLEGFKTYLKSKYDAGTPVVIYYKLQTPTRLKFTNEQKAVAKELNNARTYKNVTNITTDSKAILSLDYAKDLETLLTSKESEV